MLLDYGLPFHTTKAIIIPQTSLKFTSSAQSSHNSSLFPLAYFLTADEPLSPRKIIPTISRGSFFADRTKQINYWRKNRKKRKGGKSLFLFRFLFTKFSDSVGVDIFQSYPQRLMSWSCLAIKKVVTRKVSLNVTSVLVFKSFHCFPDLPDWRQTKYNHNESILQLPYNHRDMSMNLTENDIM